MSNYVFYYSDGTIATQYNCSDNSMNKTLASNPGLSAIQIKVHDVDKYCVNVSTDPHTIESKPVAVVDVTSYIREHRTTFLKVCDWTVGVDSPLSDSKKAEWQTYRQALRDLPSTNTATTVDTIVWPTQPE
jgi:protoheme ferro-lyase